MQNDTALFGSDTVAAVFKYGENALTYRPSDLGISDGDFPRPAVIAPGRGIWVFDQGRDMKSWTLTRFAMDGQTVYRKSVPALLGAPDSGTLIVSSAFVTAKGSVAFIASLGYDIAKDIQTDFVAVEADSAGALIASSPLPGFRFEGEAFRLPGNRMLNRQKGDLGPGWYLFTASHPVVKAAPTLYDRLPVQAGESLLEKRGRDIYRLEPFPESRRFAYAGPTAFAVEEIGPKGELYGMEPVSGEGRYFGFIKTGQDSLNELKSARLCRRTLEVLYLDPEGRVLKLGETFLRPRRYESDSYDKKADFSVYCEKQACFDAIGNLWDLEWTQEEFRVIRYDLRQAEARRRVDALGLVEAGPDRH